MSRGPDILEIVVDIEVLNFERLLRAMAEGLTFLF